MQNYRNYHYTEQYCTCDEELVKITTKTFRDTTTTRWTCQKIEDRKMLQRKKCDQQAEMIESAMKSSIDV